MGEIIKGKIKSLMPTLREKKRYLAFKLNTKKSISKEEAESLVLTTCKEYLGLKGMAKAGLIFLSDKFNEKLQCGIIRITHTSVDDTKAALIIIEKYNNELIMIRSLKVSGILQKAESSYL